MMILEAVTNFGTFKEISFGKPQVALPSVEIFGSLGLKCKREIAELLKKF